MRDLLLILHILSATAWIGGGLYGWHSYARLAGAGDEAGRSVRILSEKADRYFGPAAGLTLLSGLALVLFTDPWGWTDGFVLVGIGVFAFSAVWQPLVASKTEERLLTAIDTSRDVGPALGAFHRSAGVEIAMLLVALWAMVVKFAA